MEAHVFHDPCDEDEMNNFKTGWCREWATTFNTENFGEITATAAIIISSIAIIAVLLGLIIWLAS